MKWLLLRETDFYAFLARINNNKLQIYRNQQDKLKDSAPVERGFDFYVNMYISMLVESCSCSFSRSLMSEEDTVVA